MVKIMFGWLLAALCSGSVLAQAEVTPTPVELWGDGDYYPYSYVEDGRLTGLYPELIRKLANLMPEFEITLQPIPWKRGLLMLQRGEAFALFPPYQLPADRPFISSYSRALGTEHVVIVCRDDRVAEDFSGVWPDSYGGLTVSSNLGFLLQSGDFWEAGVAAGVKRLEFVSNMENLIQMAAIGRVDCYANDRKAIELTHAQLQARADLRKLPVQLQPLRETTMLEARTAHVGYGHPDPQRYPFAQDFQRRFDSVLSEYAASPAYEAFLQQFWSTLGAEPRFKGGPIR